MDGRLALVVAAAALLLALVWQWRGEEARATLGAVDILDWDKADLSQLDRPVVLINAPMGAWACMDWTSQSVSRAVGTLRGVKRSDAGRTFRYFHDAKPMRELRAAGVPQQPAYERTDMPSPDFFAEAEAAEPGSPPHVYYKYFHADIESVPALRRALPAQLPRSKIFGDGPGAQAEPESELLVNVWFGSAGVIADSHYDTSDNLYVQIRGAKRFLLVPPDRAGAVGVFPFSHPAYRRVRAAKFRLGPESGDQVNYALLRELGALDVELRRGDVLFLPAYWFHNVEALSPSISINLWAHSAAFLKSEAAFRAAVPFEESWSDEKNARALATYADMLLRAASNDSNLEVERVADSLLARFEPLLGEVAEFPWRCDTDSALEPVLRRGIDEIAPLFLNMASGVREICLGNYIEALAEHLFGVTQLHSFVHHCISVTRRT